MYSGIYRVQSSTRRLPIRALFGFTLKPVESYPLPSPQSLCVVVCPWCQPWVASPDNQKLNDPHLSPLGSAITYEALESALRLSKRGSAAGPDSLPYELWSHLHHVYQLNTKAESLAFNILQCMRTVLNDIQVHGVDTRMLFTLGWMCLIFKKKKRETKLKTTALSRF